MSAVLHVAGFLVGVAIVLATWQSIIVTIILPRRSRNRIALVGWLATYEVLTALARSTREAARRDAILAMLAPLNIIGLLFTWMALFAIGFGFVMWSVGAASFTNSFDLAGSSFFTLGFATGRTGLSHVLMDFAAASGMIVVGLQIGYLPTIYGAYSQREAHVTLLTMRAAEENVLTGATVLFNHPLPASADLLRALFASWETNAAAIVESHSNYPWLIAFRSPRASESWVTSMLAILDAIALLEALAPSAVPPEAEHCRFACTATLGSLSRMLAPQPRMSADGVEPLSRDAFFAALQALRDRVPFERDADAAWTHFRASRASYEGAALTLLAYTMVPLLPGGWSRPVDRAGAETIAMPAVTPATFPRTP